jgi:acetyl-CoA synthetase
MGDRVVIYMPMCPEAAIAMLACTRLGIIHSVIFGGFSSAAIKDRVNDSQAKMIITADGGYRRGAIVPLKRNVDEAVQENEHVGKVIVFRRANNQISIMEGRDVWWRREMEYVDSDCEPVSVDAEDPLYILYTSGSTGKPKGVLHSIAGYLLQVAEHHIHTSTNTVQQIESELRQSLTAEEQQRTENPFLKTDRKKGKP